MKDLMASDIDTLIVDFTPHTMSNVLECIYVYLEMFPHQNYSIDAV